MKKVRLTLAEEDAAKINLSTFYGIVIEARRLIQEGKRSKFMAALADAAMDALGPMPKWWRAPIEQALHKAVIERCEARMIRNVPTLPQSLYFYDQHHVVDTAERAGILADAAEYLECDFDGPRSFSWPTARLNPLDRTADVSWPIENNPCAEVGPPTSSFERASVHLDGKEYEVVRVSEQSETATDNSEVDWLSKERKAVGRVMSLDNPETKIAPPREHSGPVDYHESVAAEMWRKIGRTATNRRPPRGMSSSLAVTGLLEFRNRLPELEKFDCELNAERVIVGMLRRLGVSPKAGFIGVPVDCDGKPILDPDKIAQYLKWYENRDTAIGNVGNWCFPPTDMSDGSGSKVSVREAAAVAHVLGLRELGHLDDGYLAKLETNAKERVERQRQLAMGPIHIEIGEKRRLLCFKNVVEGASAPTLRAFSKFMPDDMVLVASHGSLIVECDRFEPATERNQYVLVGNTGHVAPAADWPGDQRDFGTPLVYQEIVRHYDQKDGQLPPIKAEYIKASLEPDSHTVSHGDFSAWTDTGISPAEASARCEGGMNESTEEGGSGDGSV